MRKFILFMDDIKYNENIENKFDVEFLEMEYRDLWRPLHHACFYGRIGLVKLLLSNHCDIESVTDRLYRPIHLACSEGHIDIVKILIANKCDINVFDENGCQPIHFACKNGHIDIVKVMIANKCNVNAFNEINGCRPIHFACLHKHFDIVKILIDNKSDVITSTNSGLHPIHLACNNGNIDIAKILIANQCDINVSNSIGYKPIHYACLFGHIDIVKLLIEKKCDLNVSTNDGSQPLHMACDNGSIEIVKILINIKCDINAFDNNGYQPIHNACIGGHLDIVKILIANKSDINTSNKFNECQPIHLACVNNHIDIVKILIEEKCDINAFDKINECQPIHLACVNGYIDIVKILIDSKCEINEIDKIFGYQPIHFACENSHIDIVKILIANIDCVMNRKSKIELIAKGMNLHCRNGCDHVFCRLSLGEENFKNGELIGSGAFGKVYKFKISNTNREIVIKITKYNCKDRKNIEGNINKYLFRIVHRNIVRYFGALENSEKLNIYMEYIPGGSLKNLIDKSKGLENSKVIKFSKEILEGLQFIHSKGIIHRDIKPENMLLDHDEIIKLTDFGLSKSLYSVSIDENITKTQTHCGTANYMAPEIFRGEQYYFPADIWSTGASIIHMITGKIPFHWFSEPFAIIYAIGFTRKIELRDCPLISKTMQSFINDLLTPEQSDRPSAETLLKHSIFNE